MLMPKRVKRRKQFRGSLSPLYIRAMAETDDHTLWLGTANYGICKVINEKELQ